MGNMLNYEEIASYIKQELEEEITKEAEPIINECLKEVEKLIRERIAQKLIGLIEYQYSMERMGHDLRITVRQAITDGPIR